MKNKIWMLQNYEHMQIKHMIKIENEIRNEKYIRGHLKWP
jgi:hypothetical protein